MSYTPKSYESWLGYKNGTYPEKFCHYGGEPSDGETSFERPVLKRNWRRAME